MRVFEPAELIVYCSGFPVAEILGAAEHTLANGQLGITCRAGQRTAEGFGCSDIADIAKGPCRGLGHDRIVTPEHLRQRLDGSPLASNADTADYADQPLALQPAECIEQRLVNRWVVNGLERVAGHVVHFFVGQE